LQIQAAVRICQEGGHFARPVAWRGTGLAVDLAQQLAADRIVRVAAIHATAAQGETWLLTALDLLADWEIISLELLAQETQVEVSPL
jgi:hypothetical protein